MGKKFKKSISLILVLSLLVSLVWVPKPVYAATGIQSIDDFLSGIDDWVYEHTLGQIDKKRAKYYSEALPVQSQSNYIDSNNEYNEYIYAGGNTYYYTPMTTYNNQTYQYYDIDNNIYRTTNNFEYSPTYNTYHTTYEDNSMTYNYYMQDNYTYVSYIIECPEDPNENKYFEVYYELPDGRNSYNLRKEDLKGIVFTYEVELYDRAAVDNTLGLWHLDGNLFDEVSASSQGSSYSTSNYFDAYYQGGAKLAANQSLNLSFNGSLPTDYTLEWVQYNPNNTNTLDNQLVTNTTQTLTANWSGYRYNGSSWVFDQSKTDSAIWYTRVRNFTGSNYSYRGNLGQYNKFALVSENGNLSLYINGSLQSSVGDYLPSINNNIVTFNSSSRVITNTSKIYHSSLRYDERTMSNFSRYPSNNEYDATYKVPLLNNHYEIGLFNSPSSWSLYPYLGNYNWKSLEGISTYATFYNVIYSDVGLRTLPVNHLFALERNTAYDLTYNFSYTVSTNLDILIDEVRLSEGALYSEDYIPRNEPFDLSYAYVVPSNVSEGVVYAQSSVPVSRFQVGGVRNTNPSEGELFINTTGTVADSAQQYYEGLWHPIAAAVYFEGELKNIEGFDFVNMMFVAGTSASGGSYVVEIPEEVTSLLEKIDQKLASILNPLKSATGEDYIPFKAVDTEEDVDTFHLSDLFILLVYFILFIDILSDFVSMFGKLTAWAYHLWAIEGLPGPLAGNEYFMGVHTILRGGVAFGLPQPIKIFGVLTLHDFMVILFEIAFIGVMIGFYRKKLTTFRFPSLRS